MFNRALYVHGTLISGHGGSCRHNEVSTQAAQYKAENSSLLAQLEYSNSRIEQLSQQLGTAEQEQRDYKRAADSAADILKQEVRPHSTIPYAHGLC